MEDEESGKWFHGTDDYGDDWRNGHRSFVLHRNFWIAADREGYPEFGNALFAFYLMRKAICDFKDHDQLDVDWPAFSEQVRQALARPGHQWVRKAVEVMMRACRDKGWQISLLRLKNLLPKVAQIRTLPSVAKLETSVARDEKERRLAKEIGEDLWCRWSEGSRHAFLDADVRYEMHAQDFGKRIIHFGPEVVAYAAPYERELNLRLKDLYLSEEMKVFWEKRFNGRRQSRPTLGSYLKMLECTKEMPNSLASQIDSGGVALHRSPAVLRKLGILQERRNVGAHEESGAAQLVDLRERLFAGGLLREFLSHLSPI